MMTSSRLSGDTPLPIMAADVAFKIWQRVLCGFTCDEAAGLPGDGIPPGTRWVDVEGAFNDLHAKWS